jgi:4-amino-4-deoxy-L-arabinose transferase-like glycosyltransferase
MAKTAAEQRGFPLHLHQALVIAVLALSLVLRLYGINFGFPYLYDQDEQDFVEPALEMLATRNPNPGYFQHPASTTIYMLAATYVGIFGIGYVTGTYDSPQAFADHLYRDPTIVYLIGRIEIALFGAASVLLVYLIGRRALNPLFGLLAALLAAVAPLHIWISHLIRTDVMMGFFALAAFWFCLKILDQRRWRDYILASIFTALAVMTKYPAVIFALTIVAAHASTINDWRNLRHHVKLIGSGVATLVAAFITSPFLFLDFEETLRDVSYEMRGEHLSATGEGFLPNLFWYIRYPLLDNLTLLGLGMAGVGLVACLLSRDQRKIVLTVFPVTFLLFISFLSLRQERWLVPILPFLALLVAAGVHWTWVWLRARVSARLGATASGIAVLLVITPLTYTAVAQALAIAGVQTRTVAREWMLENIPENSRVLMALYAPQLPEEHYQFYYVDLEGNIQRFDPDIGPGITYRPAGNHAFLSDTGQVQEHGIEYIVTGWLYERYRAERERYPEEMANFERLIASGELVFEVYPPPMQPNSFPIRVYRRLNPIR